MNNRLSVSTLAESLAASTGKSKKFSEDFIREFFRLIYDVLSEEEKLRIKGFGSFKVSEVAAKESIDVATGQPTTISAHKKVTFTPSPEMSLILNAPFEIFESVVIDDMPTYYPDEDESKSEQMETGNENMVGQAIVEAGSEQEAFEDEFTVEAYNNVMPEVPESIIPPIPIIPSNPIHKLTWDDFPPVEENDEEIQDFEPEFLTSRRKMSTAQIVWIVIGILIGLGIFVYILGALFNWWLNIFNIFAFNR